VLAASLLWVLSAPALRRLSPCPPTLPQGKKKPFIDRSSAAHFHLVHRSQRDPLAADGSKPQRVLVPGEVSANQGRAAWERASQSTRAWASEQVQFRIRYTHEKCGCEKKGHTSVRSF